VRIESYITLLGIVLTSLGAFRLGDITMAPRKLINTAEQLYQTFTRLNNELGEGNKNARGIVALHPTGHWYGTVETEYYARKAFDLDCLQVLRPEGWLERGMRKEGVDEFWALDRLIAAAMEYTGDEYESLMKVFFRAWENDLKPDGRPQKNKAAWVRWCELHLVRHHRMAKAERAVDVLHELGLLYPGWWKQIYAQLHGTAVPAANYVSPWDDQPSINFAEMHALNQTYARVTRTIIPLKDQPAMPPQRSNRESTKTGPHAPRKQNVHKKPADSAMDSPESESEIDEPANKRVKTNYFREALEDTLAAAASSAAADARRADNDKGDDSDASFTPEDFYPDWIHEHDAIVGRPATTYPQLSHTIGFAPGADAWRALNEPDFAAATRFNPQLNATTAVDSAHQDAVRRARAQGAGTSASVPAVDPYANAMKKGSEDVVWYTPTEEDLAMLPPNDGY